MFAKAIDDYELIKNIGKGSYGQVFLAKEKSQKEKNSIMLSQMIVEEEEEEKKDDSMKKDFPEKFWAIKQVS